MAAEREQTLGQVGSLLSRGKDLLHVGFHYAPVRYFLLDETGVPHDGRQNVVEIMGHASCQIADGLHLLKLTEPVFEALEFGHILANHKMDAGGKPEGYKGYQLLSSVATGNVKGPGFSFTGLVSDEILHPCGYHQRPVFLVRIRLSEPCAAIGHFVKTVTEHLPELGVHVGKDAFPVNEHHPDRSIFGKDPKLFLLLLQSLFRHLSFCQVNTNTEKVLQSVLFVLDGPAMPLHKEPAPVTREEMVLTTHRLVGSHDLRKDFPKGFLFFRGNKSRQIVPCGYLLHCIAECVQHRLIHEESLSVAAQGDKKSRGCLQESPVELHLVPDQYLRDLVLCYILNGPFVMEHLPFFVLYCPPIQGNPYDLPVASFEPDFPVLHKPLFLEAGFKSTPVFGVSIELFADIGHGLYQPFRRVVTGYPCKSRIHTHEAAIRGRLVYTFNGVLEDRAVPGFALYQCLFGIHTSACLTQNSPGFDRVEYKNEEPGNKEPDDREPAVAKPLHRGEGLVFRCGHYDRPEGVPDIDRHVDRVFQNFFRFLFGDKIVVVGGNPRPALHHLFRHGDDAGKTT